MRISSKAVVSRGYALPTRHCARPARADGAIPVLRGRTRRPCGRPSRPGGCSLRADGHPDRALLSGNDGMRVGAVWPVGLPDGAVTVVGPVQVPAVGATNCHALRVVLAADDGKRVGAVKGGNVDRAVTAVGPEH